MLKKYTDLLSSAVHLECGVSSVKPILLFCYTHYSNQKAITSGQFITNVHVTAKNIHLFLTTRFVDEPEVMDLDYPCCVLKKS